MPCVLLMCPENHNNQIVLIPTITGSVKESNNNSREKERSFLKGAVLHILKFTRPFKFTGILKSTGIAEGRRRGDAMRRKVEEG